MAPAGRARRSAPPAGVSIVGNTLDGRSWALTMVPGAPPTFSCGPAAAAGTTTSTTIAATTTTAAATTTTTAVASNGVTAIASNAGDRLYYGESIVTETNPAPLTAMTVTINVRQTAGVAHLSEYTNSWGGTVSASSTTAGGFIVYTFSLNPGQTIVAGSWKMDGQLVGYRHAPPGHR